MSEETIKVCHRCGTPLVWTFAFMGAEYYCIGCGGNYGMLGAGRNEEETPELKKQFLSVKIKWGQVAKHLQSGGGWKTDCEKCKPMVRGNEHYTHLTDEEIKKHEWAMKRLEAMLLPEYQNTPSPPLTMSETMTRYGYWLTANEDDLREQWDSMKEVEQHEMGETFENYCQLQYTDGYGL